MAASMFAPPRNKPKISLPQPQLSPGQPMPQVQTINRPVNLVDDEGNVHGRLGENGQEQVTVTPSGLPTNDPAGGPNYASGGTLLIGGDGGYQPKPGGPDDGFANYGAIPPPSPPSDNSFVNYGAIPAPTSPANSAPPVQAKPSITSVPLQQPYGNVNANLLQAQQNQLQSRNTALDYRAKVLDLKGATQPQQQAVYDAKGQVINLQAGTNAARKSALTLSKGNQQARGQELQDIYAASKNAPDILNVADATNRYRAEDRRASAMGVSPEAEADLPPEWNGPRLPGVRPKIMSQEDRLKERAGYEDPIRANQLAMAQTIVDLMGTDVAAAQQQAERAGLTLQQANDLVEQAQRESEYAGIASQRSDLEAQSAGLAPFPGAERYTDPQTGQASWYTPDEVNQLQAQYQQNVQKPYQTGLTTGGSALGGLDENELLKLLVPTAPSRINPPGQEEAVRAELIRKYMALYGLTHQQAVEKANAAIAQAKKTPGFSEITSQGVKPSAPVQNVPVTTQNQPGGAPSGTNSTDNTYLPPWVQR